MLMNIECRACVLAVLLRLAVSARQWPLGFPANRRGSVTVGSSAFPWSFLGFSEKLELLSWGKSHG